MYRTTNIYRFYLGIFCCTSWTSQRIIVSALSPRAHFTRRANGAWNPFLCRLWASCSARYAFVDRRYFVIEDTGMEQGHSQMPLPVYRLISLQIRFLNAINILKINQMNKNGRIIASTALLYRSFKSDVARPFSGRFYEWQCFTLHVLALINIQAQLKLVVFHIDC